MSLKRLDDASDDLNVAMNRLGTLAASGPSTESILELTRVIGNLAVTHAMLYDLLKDILPRMLGELRR